MVGQGSTGVKDNTLPSLPNQMQIKLKAAEQQIPPPAASLWTPGTVPPAPRLFPFASFLSTTSSSSLHLLSLFL